MSDLNNYSVDDEMGKYIDAFEIKSAGVKTQTLSSSPRRYNPNTNRNDVLARMKNGGYVKIGEEPVIPFKDAPANALERVAEPMLPFKDAPANMVANLQTDAPAQPTMQENTDQPMDTPGASIESAIEYANTVKTNQGQVTANDMLAAGYDESTIKAIGIGADVEPMVLSTQEIEDRLRNGGSFIGEYDPTIRETGRVELTQYLTELAEDSLAEDLRAQGLTQDQIELELQAERPRIANESKSLSGMFFGDETTFGIGVGDFVTAGVMDIQEGARLFKQGLNNDSVADRSFGALLVLAGIAEATGVGALVGKAIKKSIPTLRAGLADVGERLNQPGQMPPLGSNLGNVDALRREANIQRFGNDPNDPVAKVKTPTENKPGIIAFHGSGADFDEFKLEEIGTGEGNQAFGYGLYFTDAEDIAKFYRDAVGAGNEVSYKGRVIKDLDEDYAEENNIAHMVGQQNDIKDKKRVVENEIARTRRSLSGIKQSIKDFNENPKVYPLKFNGMEITMDVAEGQRDFLQRRLDAALAVEKNIDKIETKPSGKMYQVSLNIKDNELLDYDGTFEDQSPFAQQAILNSLNEITLDDAVNLGVDIFSSRYNGDESMAISDAKQIMLDNFTVVRFLNDWSVLRGAENSGEELLQKQGVKGIKYQANKGVGSRIVPETGEQNYVIFDDKLINIMKKYGIAAPVAVSSMAVKSSDQEDET